MGMESNKPNLLKVLHLDHSAFENFPWVLQTDPFDVVTRSRRRRTLSWDNSIRVVSTNFDTNRQSNGLKLSWDLIAN